MKDFSAAGNYVLVNPHTVEEMTDGGIFLPPIAIQNQKYESTRGTIYDIGPDARVQYKDDEGKKVNAKIGDFVMYVKYGGSLFKSGHKEFRLLHDSDILVICGDEKEELKDSRKPVYKAKDDRN